MSGDDRAPVRECHMGRMWVMIFVGGGIGSVARYLIAGWTQSATQSVFPIGTMCVNLIGCLLIGFFASAFEGRWLVQQDVRQMALVGVLGGFTTFSTFSHETFKLLADQQYRAALLNIVMSVVLCLSGVWIGYRLAQKWLGA